jgi:peptidoglycan/LPS O-acetylase OafA/YrhL
MLRHQLARRRRNPQITAGGFFYRRGGYYRPAYFAIVPLTAIVIALVVARSQDWSLPSHARASAEWDKGTPKRAPGAAGLRLNVSKGGYS